MVSVLRHDWNTSMSMAELKENYIMKDGRVIDGREHFYDLYAWDQFWS